jgi:hypothetical protein
MKAVGNSACSWDVRETRISNNSSVGHVSPGHGKISSIASLVDVITSNQVLSWEDNINSTIRGNGKSIGKSFGGSEGPAWSALLLISDGMDVIGPLFSGIESGRGTVWDLRGLETKWFTDDGAHKSFDLWFRELGQRVGGNFFGSPVGGGLFDLINNFLVNGMLGWGSSENSSDDSELEHMDLGIKINYYNFESYYVSDILLVIRNK